MSSFVRHVECTVCGARRERRPLLTVCDACGQMLAVRYDVERVRSAVTPEVLRARGPGMYRFRELTPLAADEEPVALGEGSTPLLPLARLAAHVGLRHLWGKDEGQNPTGTFKARGLGMAITCARSAGARGFAIPSAGNAGGAAALYAARAGLPCVVVVPRDTPAAAIAEASIAGARVFTLEGSIATAGRLVGRLAPRLGWLDLSTLKEPYRLEGKKTMGLELAEQLGWSAPDWLLYPTGGGTGLLGIAKAYEELRELGWVKDAAPRMVCVQAEGCAPVVRAWRQGAPTTQAWESPHTHAGGLRVPSPFAGRQILAVLRAGGGCARSVGEREIEEAQRLLARLEGVWTSPEAAATVAALLALREERAIEADARVVLVLTGSGLKNPPPSLPAPIDLQGDDDASLERIAALVAS